MEAGFAPLERGDDGQAVAPSGGQQNSSCEHLAESEITAAEVDSLAPAQHLTLSLQTDERLRFERLSDLSRVVVNLEDGKIQDVIDWIGCLKDLGTEGEAEHPGVVFCRRECTNPSCGTSCCVQIAGRPDRFCSGKRSTSN